MTIASEVNRSGPYVCNGVTTHFPYGFRIYDAAHLRVILTDPQGTESMLTLGTDYTVSGVGDSDGGAIDTAAAYAAGYRVTLVLNVPFTQNIDLENQGAYFAETIERAIDLQTQMSLQLKEQVARSVVLPVTSSVSVDRLTGAVLSLAEIQPQMRTLAPIAEDIVTVAGVASAVVAAEGNANTATAAAGVATGKAAEAAASAAAAQTWNPANYFPVGPGNLALGVWTDVASATSVDLGAQTSRNIRITGTTTITSFGTAGPADNVPYLVRFAAAVTLTNGTSLILPGAANIITAAGDVAIIVHDSASIWRVIAYFRTGMPPLIAGTGAGNLLALNASVQIPAVDGSLLTNMKSLGAGQTLQDVTASRAAGVIYQNASGKDLLWTAFTQPGSSSGITAMVGATASTLTTRCGQTVGASNLGTVTTIIAAWEFYELAGTFTKWLEYRL